MIRVLVTRELPDVAVQLLRGAGFDVTAWAHEHPMNATELFEAARHHEALLCSLTDGITTDFLQRQSHIRAISQFGVGYDNIDVATATQLGIAVGNTPDVLTDATADVAFGLMIAVSRKMFHLHKSILQGAWSTFKPKGNLGVELRGKTIGIVGMGRIGQAMARRCFRAFDMEVLYHNRKPLAEPLDFPAQYRTFDQLLQQSDVVSVHCALTSETKGLFGEHAFRSMKSSAIFINTARGGVHDEVALTTALQEGRLWGAGLDVTNPEPMRKDHLLLSMETVAILPHIGSATVEARTAMARLAAENLIGFFQTGKMPHPVNTVG